MTKCLQFNKYKNKIFLKNRVKLHFFWCICNNHANNNNQHNWICKPNNFK